MPINSGPLDRNDAKMTSSISTLQHTRSLPAYGTATLDGRVGTPVTTVFTNPLATATVTMVLEGSRCGTYNISCAASAQVRKNGFVKPVAIVVIAPLLIWTSLMPPD